MARHEGKKRDERLERTWRDRIQRWRSCGGSVREFCRREEVPEASFYHWRREIARRGAERTVKPKRRRALFVPVRVMAEAPSAPGGEIAIALTDGRRIHLTPPVDKQALSDILAVMEVRPC